MDLQNIHQDKLEALKTLKQTDIELAYLALLTMQGIKPLSRYEKHVNEETLKALKNVQLITKQIERLVKNGSTVVETIFSVTPAYVEIYESCFKNTYISKDAETVRFEGFLFGFPPCCTEQYIKQPYAENNLDKEIQRHLFHWACYNCKITPLLIEDYQKSYNFINNL